MTHMINSNLGISTTVAEIWRWLRCI